MYGRLIRQTFTTELVHLALNLAFSSSLVKESADYFWTGQVLRIKVRLLEARYDSAQRLLANQEHKISVV